MLRDLTCVSQGADLSKSFSSSLYTTHTSTPVSRRPFLFTRIYFDIYLYRYIFSAFQSDWKSFVMTTGAVFTIRTRLKFRLRCRPIHRCCAFYFFVTYLNHYWLVGKTGIQVINQVNPFKNSLFFGSVTFDGQVSIFSFVFLSLGRSETDTSAAGHFRFFFDWIDFRMR